jgi:hypothetical protein
MGAITSSASRASDGSERDVGVAGPPPSISYAPGAAKAVAGARAFSLRDWWKSQWAKGWAGSLTLHCLLLLLLAGWYFAPRVVRTVEIESTLSGSLDGHPDGDQAIGGSNGSPISLAGELDALEKAASKDEPEINSPRLTDAPQISLADQPLALSEAAPLPAAGATRRGGGRPIGRGDQGNPGAGNGEGFGLARFGDGGEVIRGVAVKVGDPQFTLMWDTKGADIDLHVIEPGGDRIYFGDRKGDQGGVLDVDNTWGYGPENIYWLVPSKGRKKIKGPGPPGAYRWSVHYYASHRPDRPQVHWQVRIKHAGEAKIVEGWLSAPGEWSQVYVLKVHPPKEGGGEEVQK